MSAALRFQITLITTLCFFFVLLCVKMYRRIAWRPVIASIDSSKKAKHVFSYYTHISYEFQGKLVQTSVRLPTNSMAFISGIMGKTNMVVLVNPNNPKHAIYIDYGDTYTSIQIWTSTLVSIAVFAFYAWVAIGKLMQT